MTFAKRKSIMKAFIESQFVCYLSVFMFCGRQADVRINHIHDRALGAVYNDEVSPFEEPLEKGMSGTIQQ